MEIPVKPGTPPTIIANGQVVLGKRAEYEVPSNGPWGFSDPEMKREKFLLPATGAQPYNSIGALIGSLDGFKTGFVIGGDATFLIPEGATKLSLALNGVAGRYDAYTGEGFEVNVVTGQPVFPPTRLAEHTNPQLGTPARLAAGANLPQFTVDIMEIDRRLKRFRPNGYVIYGVYASHPKRGNGAKAARESPP